MPLDVTAHLQICRALAPDPSNECVKPWEFEGRALKWQKGVKQLKRKSKLTLQERSVIEISLYQGMTLEEIGLKLDRHPTTIAREIKSNRTLA